MQITFAGHDVSLRNRAAAVMLLSLVAGCSSSPSSSDAGDLITCQDDSRVAVYRPNLPASSTTGTLSFTLSQANPAPPAVGINTWTLRVANSSGQPVPNLPLSVLPFMPDHGHGTSVQAQVTANPDSSYSVTPLYFFMPGVWRITFSTTPDAGLNSSGVFFFCVPG